MIATDGTLRRTPVSMRFQLQYENRCSDVIVVDSKLYLVSYLLYAYLLVCNQLAYGICDSLIVISLSLSCFVF